MGRPKERTQKRQEQKKLPFTHMSHLQGKRRKVAHHGEGKGVL